MLAIFRRSAHFTAALVVGLATAIMSVALPSVVSATGGSWTFTDGSTTTRTAHTFTQLQNGKILLAGGYDPTQPGQIALATAEIYDPHTAVWTPTGNMNVPRFGHSAVLLADGKVLVMGGSSAPYQPITSAEIYDPVTGTWSVTGNLNHARTAFTAARLHDGRVIAVSGYTGGPLLNSSEIYNPSTGTWSDTGSVVTPRLYHTAITLSNGKVLVAGANTYGNPTAAAELYDPSTGQWAPTAPMSRPRDASATFILLQDGRVLALGGGSTYYTPNITQTGEVYDPVTATWSPTADMDAPRGGMASTVMANGKVLVAGGYDVSLASLSSCLIYDPVANTWSPVASMNTPRNGANSALLDTGKVLVYNGTNDGTNILNTAEVYSYYTLPAWSGFLQPINADGSSIFKLGRTVPTKFRLTGGSAGITNLQARLYASKISGDIEGSEEEMVSTAAADTGNTFRYDPTSQQYIFNLNTQNLSAGTWHLKVYVNGDNTNGMLLGSVTISLR